MSGDGSNINADQGKPMFNFGAATASSTPFVFGSQNPAKTPAKTADGTSRSQNPNTSGSTSALEAKIQELTSIADIALECANFWFLDTVLYVSRRGILTQADN